MSDHRLRNLERRWRETGSDEDHTAFRAEQLRAGALSWWRVYLAAYAGDTAALVLTERRGQPPVVPDDLRTWSKTVAQEVPGWRVSAWLLGFALSETIRAKAGYMMRPSSDALRAFDAVASWCALTIRAADVNCWAAVQQEAGVIDGLISHAAARETMWPEDPQGWIATIAIRVYEILTLERWHHVGEIVDHCAQAISRYRNEQRFMAHIRTRLMTHIKRSLIERAWGVSGPPNDKTVPMPPVPMSVMKADDIDPDVLARIKREPA